MNARRLVVLAILLVLPAVAARPDPADPKDLPPEEQALQTRINEAIDAGVAWLKKEQAADGSWTGFGRSGSTGLALFTLLSSDVPKSDPAVKKAAAFLTGLPVKNGTARDVMIDRPAAVRMTYDHALTILALTTLDPKAHRRTIQRSVSALIESQDSSGQWAYIVSMGGPLDGGDNSNTQFALLALRRAALAGFSVPKSVWTRSYRHFERSIEKDGGWGYGCAGNVEGTYGSMTAVGVASLVICRSMLLGPEKAAKFDYWSIRPLVRGMIWLEDRFAVDGHPGKIVPPPMPGAPGGGGGPDAAGDGKVPMGRRFHYYWLYAVERVGMLLGRRHIGDHDWYREGATWLVENQFGDGGWRNAGAAADAPEPPVAATCFALLFLKRATLPVVTPPVRRR